MRARSFRKRLYGVLTACVRLVDPYLPIVNWFFLLGTPVRTRELLREEKQTVFPATMASTDPPRGLQATVHRNFAPERYYPEVFLTRLKNGISTRHGYNLTAAGELIPELSVEAYLPTFYPHWSRQIELNDYLIWKIPVRPPSATLDERVTTLTSRWQDSYFHWLFEVLPRLHLLERLGVHPGRLYVDISQPFQRATLRHLAHQPEDVIPARSRECVWASELIIPSVPGVPGIVPGWVCRYLRQKLLPAALDDTCVADGERRLYVSRRRASRRRVTNDNEVESLLKTHGFQCVVLEDLKFESQARLFHEAAVVVAAHGAGLSNSVFCRPGTVVIELFSPNYVNPCYWHLASGVGLIYHYLIGHGTDRVPAGLLWQTTGCRDDITVPIGDLDKLIRVTCQETLVEVASG